MIEPVSILGMAGLISQGRAGPLTTDMAAESRLRKGEPSSYLRKWQPEEIWGAHEDLFYAPWIIYGGADLIYYSSFLQIKN